MTDQIKAFAAAAVSLKWSPVELTEKGRLKSSYHYGQLASIGHILRGDHAKKTQANVPDADSDVRTLAIDLAVDLLDNNRRKINKAVKKLLLAERKQLELPL